MKNDKIKYVLFVCIFFIICQISVFPQNIFELDEKTGTMPDIMFSNGTGVAITEIQIRPSQKLYKGNVNVFSLANLALVDTGILAVALPQNINGLDGYDLTIITEDAKIYKTKTAIKFPVAEHPSILNLNFKNKKSILGEMARNDMGGTIILAGIPYILHGKSAAYVVTLITKLGRFLPGGGLREGVLVLASIPLIVNAIVKITASWWENLFPGELIVTHVNYEIIPITGVINKLSGARVETISPTSTFSDSVIQSHLGILGTAVFKDSSSNVLPSEVNIDDLKKYIEMTAKDGVGLGVIGRIIDE